jgi:hypothetical protein
MSKIVDFPKREFRIQIELPANKIVNIRKKAEDKIKLELSEHGSFAFVEAVNLAQAQNIAKRILPDSVIVDESWIAG